MKPASWENLPLSVREQFLWDCELEYDSYDSGKAECIHEILNGVINDENQRIVDMAWKSMSPETFRLRLEQARDTVKEQLRLIEEMIDTHRRFPV
jgi:hypothetical protein